MRRCFGWVLCGVIVGIVAVCSGVTASAQESSSFNWRAGATATAATDVPDLTPDTIGNTCRYETVYVEKTLGSQYVCMYRADGFRYGIVTTGWGATMFAVELPGYSTLLLVGGVQASGFTEMPLSKDLLVTTVG